jgi:HEAT repeat protein
MLAERAKYDPDPGISSVALQKLIKICREAGKHSALEIGELVGFLIHAIQNKRDVLAGVATAALVHLSRLDRKFPENSGLEKYLAAWLPRQISQGMLQDAAQTAALLGKSNQIATILKPCPQNTRLEILAYLFKEDAGLAARVASNIGYREAIPLLVDHLYLNNPQVTSALLALDARESIPQMLQSLPVVGEAKDFSVMIDVIARLGDASTVDLILARVNQKANTDPQKNNFTIEVSLLTGLGKRDSSYLTSAFRDDLPPLEWEVLLQSLGRVADKETVPVILAQASRNPSAAFLPLLILNLKDNRFAPFLADHLAGWGGQAREHAIRALGELSDPVVIPILIDQINQNNNDLTKAATKALERQYQNKSISYLDKQLILKTVYLLSQRHTDNTVHLDEGDKRWVSDCSHTDGSTHTDLGPQIKI